MQHCGIKRRKTGGSALLEFVFVGITLIFTLISIVEMSRGMWNYHTLEYAVKASASYASVHGATCSITPNACSVHVSDVVNVFRIAAIGVPMSQVRLTLTTASGGATTCNPVSTCSSNAAWSNMWPPSTNSDNAIGQAIVIRADYTFRSALAMFVPGRGVVAFGSNVGPGAFSFPGYSRQTILF